MMNEYADEVIGIIPPICSICLKGSEPIAVRKADFHNWRNGMLIQHAFPEMPTEIREMLISGTHPACWDSLYAEEIENDKPWRI